MHIKLQNMDQKIITATREKKLFKVQANSLLNMAKKK